MPKRNWELQDIDPENWATLHPPLHPRHPHRTSSPAILSHAESLQHYLGANQLPLADNGVCAAEDTMGGDGDEQEGALLTFARLVDTEASIAPPHRGGATDHHQHHRPRRSSEVAASGSSISSMSMRDHQQQPKQQHAAAASTSAASAPSLAAKGLLFRTPTSNAPPPSSSASQRSRPSIRSQTFSEGSYRQQLPPYGVRSDVDAHAEGSSVGSSSHTHSPASMPQIPQSSYNNMMRHHDQPSPYGGMTDGSGSGASPPLHQQQPQQHVGGSNGPSPNARPSPTGAAPTPEALGHHRHSEEWRMHGAGAEWGGTGEMMLPAPALVDGQGQENHAANSATQDRDGGGAIVRKVSCLECRGSKVKCSGQPPDGSACLRCRRGNRECVWQKHKRGRKPIEQVRFHKLEEKFEQISKEIETFRRRQAEEIAANGAGVETASGGPGAGASVTPGAAMGMPPNWSTPTSSSFDTLLSAGSLPASARLAALDNSASSSSNKDNNWNSTLVPPPQLPPIPDTFGVLSSRPSSSSTNEASFLSKADEPTNLGLPALSNPLKLLAQASGTARDQPDSGSGRIDEDDDDDEDIEMRSLPAPRPRPRSRPPSSLTPHRPHRTALGRDYFAHGIYASRHDLSPHFDPISLGLLSPQRAQTLYDLFLERLNPNITLLDPALHTLPYVRSHSALLLTALCALAARFSAASTAASEVRSLDAHIRRVLLPAVLLDGYRSVEISQAFVVLAAYHPPTRTLAEDRSWSLLGYGIRIAAELDMNSRMVSGGGGGGGDGAGGLDEETQRRLRNRERTYLNLWLFEQSLSTHMGRRPTLANDPVILASPRWHLSPHAIPEDEAIVAVVQLRRIMARHLESFEALRLGGGAGAMEAFGSGLGYEDARLDFFRRSCNADIDAWAATWCAEGSGAEAETTTTTKTTQRLAKGPLYAHYARIILLSCPLRSASVSHPQQHPFSGNSSSSGTRTGLEIFHQEIYVAAIAYLCYFLQRLVPRDMVTDGNNSTCVTVVYVAVFALRFVGGAGAEGGGGGGTAQMTADGEPSVSAGGIGTGTGRGEPSRRPPYVDAKLVLNLVERLVRVLQDAGNVTPHRAGTAGSYAPYLAAVLARAKGERLGAGMDERDRNAEAQSPLGSEGRGASPATAVGLSQGFQFHAGPSGVQASELDFDEYVVGVNGAEPTSTTTASGTTGVGGPAALETTSLAKKLAESLGLVGGLRDSFFEDLSDVGLSVAGA